MYLVYGSRAGLVPVPARPMLCPRVSLAFIVHRIPSPFTFSCTLCLSVGEEKRRQERELGGHEKVRG